MGIPKSPGATYIRGASYIREKTVGTACCNNLSMTGPTPPLWHEIPVACELLAEDRMPCRCCGAPMDDEEV